MQLIGTFSIAASLLKPIYTELAHNYTTAHHFGKYKIPGRTIVTLQYHDVVTKGQPRQYVVPTLEGAFHSEKALENLSGYVVPLANGGRQWICALHENKPINPLTIVGDVELTVTLGYDGVEGRECLVGFAPVPSDGYYSPPSEGLPASLDLWPLSIMSSPTDLPKYELTLHVVEGEGEPFAYYSKLIAVMSEIDLRKPSNEILTSLYQIYASRLTTPVKFIDDVGAFRMGLFNPMELQILNLYGISTHGGKYFEYDNHLLLANGQIYQAI